MHAFCLTVHAGYRCQHAGACCTAGWPIPLEPERVAALRDRGFPLRLRQDASIPIVETTANGACVCYDEDHGRLCAIQRDAGASLMPTACRNFPRVTLHDRRGVFITLSHFCPTAARLLLTAGDIAVIPAPETISLGGDVEGLDATNVMPPLLRPEMLSDLDGYATWETEALAVLNDRQYAARHALRMISAATNDVCEWSPGEESLSACVRRSFDCARFIAKPEAGDPQSSLEHPIKAFLAAHLFASWHAYENGGLTAIVESLESAFRLLGDNISDEHSFIEAVRAADFRLRHSGDRLSPHAGPRSVPALRHD